MWDSGAPVSARTVTVMTTEYADYVWDDVNENASQHERAAKDSNRRTATGVGGDAIPRDGEMIRRASPVLKANSSSF
jgi:hypothetical protein